MRYIDLLKSFFRVHDLFAQVVPFIIGRYEIPMQCAFVTWTNCVIQKLVPNVFQIFVLYEHHMEIHFLLNKYFLNLQNLILYGHGLFKLYLERTISIIITCKITNVAFFTKKCTDREYFVFYEFSKTFLKCVRRY